MVGDHFGPCNLEDIFRDLKRLEEFYFSVILNEDTGYSLTYRKKKARILRRFFAHVSERFGFPPVTRFLSREPHGMRARTALPLPRAIATTMATIAEKFPEILALAILLVCYGLRGEEAYRLLEDLRSHLAKTCLYIPYPLSRNEKPRNIRHRPNAKAWIAFLLSKSDPTMTDFRPHYPNGGVMPAPAAMARLYAVLRAQTPLIGKMPTDLLRKCWIAASIACEVPLHELLKEAGSSGVPTIHDHLDRAWCPAEGNAFFDIRPPKSQAQD